MEDLKKDIHGKYKWNVNAMLDKGSWTIPAHSGYFGVFGKITYKGKQAVVFEDDREATVEVRTGFYDEIYYGHDYKSVWDPDYRWNHDMPLVVRNGNKYNLIAPHDGRELIKEWLDCIDLKWESKCHIGYVLIGYRGEEEVYITPNGTVLNALANDELSVKNQLNIVKGYTADEAEERWVNQGKRCGYQCGLTFRGAGKSIISTEKAKELIKTHRRFNGDFYSLKWEIVDGQLTLMFHDYSGSDYD